MRNSATPSHAQRQAEAPEQPTPAPTVIIVTGVSSRSAAHSPEPKPGPAGVTIAGVPSQSTTGF
jgi:hypothetical protein